MSSLSLRVCKPENQGSCAGFLVQRLTPFLQCSDSMEWREAAGAGPLADLPPGSLKCQLTGKWTLAVSGRVPANAPFTSPLSSSLFPEVTLSVLPHRPPCQSMTRCRKSQSDDLRGTVTGHLQLNRGLQVSSPRPCDRLLGIGKDVSSRGSQASQVQLTEQVGEKRATGGGGQGEPAAVGNA